MLRTIVVSVYLNVFVFAYFQKDYLIKYERITDLYWNKEYLQEFNFSNSFFNRTTRVFSWSVIVVKPLSTHIKFKLQTYKFLSNEYRYFPVFYEENPCLALATDVFGNSATHFDTNVKKCPLGKGFYYVRNITFDQSQFPPYAPRGRFMFDIRMLENDVDLVKGKLYVKVVPTNPLEIVSAY